MSHESSREAAMAAAWTEPRTYDLSTLEAALGLITAREFDATSERNKPALWEWLLAIKNMSDDELYHVTRSAIVDEALVQRFRNINFSEIYCRTSACYAEAERRLMLERHAHDCRASGIYGRAHAAVMTTYGYEPSSIVRPCTCGARRYDDLRGETPSDED